MRQRDEILPEGSLQQKEKKEKKKGRRNEREVNTPRKRAPNQKMEKYYKAKPFRLSHTSLLIYKYKLKPKY